MTEVQGDIIINYLDAINSNIVAYVGPLLDQLIKIVDLLTAIVFLVAFVLGWLMASKMEPKVW